MSIYNLGTFGEKRRNQFADALQTGVGYGLYAKGLKQKNEQATVKAENEATKNALTAQGLILKGKKAEAELEQTNRKGYAETIQRLALKYMGKPDEFKIFASSVPGKELLKNASKYLPEIKDQDGNYSIDSFATDAFKNKLDRIKAEVVEKKVSGQKLTAGEEQAFQFFNTHKTDDAALAFKAAANYVSNPNSPKFHEAFITSLKMLSENKYGSQLQSSPQGQDENDQSNNVDSYLSSVLGD